MENHYYNIGGDNLITINATMSNLIKIGHQGENKAVQVAFDLTPFQSAFSGGHPQLVVRRPGDNSGYPVTLIVDGSQAIWIVSSSDTEKYGHGQCELQWFVGDTLAKSDKYNFLIYSSIPGDAEPPDVPSKAWFDKILSDIGNLSDLDTEAKENLVSAINEARQTGGGGTGGTNDHTKLSNRDAADQHPIGAITGLEAALDGKQPAGSYLTEESDPTVPAWAKEAQKPSYTAQEVGADPSGTSAGLVSAHNTAEAAHNDIRLLIFGLTDRLNALADSDDTTLDQLSEVVAYIKSNRTLIEAITTSKVSVSDIVNDLVTNVTNKPLSAAQGVALKALIDAISVPDALPNPNALTFTGAVTGSYDGSAPLSVEIPSGGGGGGSSQWKIIRDLTITENAARVDINTDDAGEAFSLHDIQVFCYTMSYEDTAESFIFLMNGYWGTGDPYFNSGFKSTKSSDNYYAYNHFIAMMQDGIANVFQPWKQYITNLQTGGDVFSIGDKYQAIESVSFVGKFIAGCRFVLVGRVSS